ncbi:MAG: 2,3,4,5-tetrahydropyridine-2,6-dicarboxylate N-succinyltransferase, partial [Candidatus Eisenbacteria bacterium]
MNPAELEPEVEACAADAALAKSERGRAAGRAVMAALDRGALRVAGREPRAEPDVPSAWRVHAWVKRGILLYFQNESMTDLEAGPLRFRDKVPLKSDLAAAGVRVVPPGTVRYGAFLEPGVIVM